MHCVELCSHHKYDLNLVWQPANENYHNHKQSKQLDVGNPSECACFVSFNLICLVRIVHSVKLFTVFQGVLCCVCLLACKIHFHTQRGHQRASLSFWPAESHNFVHLSPITVARMDRGAITQVNTNTALMIRVSAARTKVHTIYQLHTDVMEALYRLP